MIFSGTAAIYGFEEPDFKDENFQEENLEEEVEDLEPEINKEDLFAVLEELGFDSEFLKSKEIVVVEKVDDKFVPRYISHAPEKKVLSFKIFDTKLAFAVAGLSVVLSTPLFYKLFRSKKYDVLGDMAALIYTLVASGGVSYITGKLTDVVVKKSADS
jgi:hypothetical protein